MKTRKPNVTLEVANALANFEAYLLNWNANQNNSNNQNNNTTAAFNSWLDERFQYNSLEKLQNQCMDFLTRAQAYLVQLTDQDDPDVNLRVEASELQRPLVEEIGRMIKYREILINIRNKITQSKTASNDASSSSRGQSFFSNISETHINEHIALAEDRLGDIREMNGQIHRINIIMYREPPGRPKSRPFGSS